MIKRFFPFIFLFLLVILYFLPVFLNPDKILHGGDFIVDYPWKSFVKQELSNGILPLWNPYDRSGFPSFAHPAYGLWYPGNLLFLIFPVSFAINLSIVLHVLIAALFTFLFARSFKLGVIASLTAAVIFAFNGFLPVRLFSGHRVIIEAMAWIPVILFFLQRYFETGKGKHLILCGVSIAMQALVGYPTIIVYTLEALIIFVLFDPVKTLKYRAKALIKASFIGVALSAIQTIPFLELTRFLTRTNFTFDISMKGSFLPQFFLTFISPFVFGNPLKYTYTESSSFWEVSSYPGFLSVLLFSFSIIYFFKKKGSQVLVFWVIGVVMIFLALGSANPFYKYIWEFVPFYHSTRVPARHMLIFAFSFAVLAGMGMQAIKNRIIQIIVLAIIVIDLFLYGQNFIRMEDPKIFQGNERIISYLKTDKSLFRLYQTYDIYSYMRVMVMDFNPPFMYGISTVKAYDPYVLRPYHDFINSIEGKSEYGEFDVPLTNTTSPDLNFLNAKYFLTEASILLKEPRFKKVLTDTYYNLYENKEVEERFFLDGKNKGEINVLKYSPLEVVIKVNAKENATLASSELYYPGWKMEIDGKKANFLMIKNYFRGAEITKGEHIIRWYFLPTSLLIGGIISALAFLFCAITFKKR